jgi:hypothetical protein
MGTTVKEKAKDEVSLAKDFVRRALAELDEESLLPEDLLRQAAEDSSTTFSEGALINAVWDLAQLGEVIVTKDWRIRRAA